MLLLVIIVSLSCCLNRSSWINLQSTSVGIALYWPQRGLKVIAEQESWWWIVAMQENNCDDDSQYGIDLCNNHRWQESGRKRAQKRMDSCERGRREVKKNIINWFKLCYFFTFTFITIAQWMHEKKSIYVIFTKWQQIWAHFIAINNKNIDSFADREDYHAVYDMTCSEWKTFCNSIASYEWQATCRAASQLLMVFRVRFGREYHQQSNVRVNSAKKRNNHHIKL